MKQIRSLDTCTFAPERKRSIIIEDSMVKYLSFFTKKSYILTPRNFLRRDPTVIDYDLDSEDEWNEQNGEDVAADNKGDEDEDDEIEKMLIDEGDGEEEVGFIVPDDYLSASEMNLSQS